MQNEAEVHLLAQWHVVADRSGGAGLIASLFGKPAAATSEG